MDEQLAQRLERLKARQDAQPPAPTAAGAPRSRSRRRHAAQRSRHVVGAGAVVGMLTLTGVFALNAAGASTAVLASAGSSTATTVKAATSSSTTKSPTRSTATTAKVRPSAVTTTSGS